MIAEQPTILVMAAGTGGHVFPALAIARKLEALGAKIEWLGTRRGMENELLAGMGMHIHPISVSGLKGSGLVRKLKAPFMLLTALVQSMRVIGTVRPDCVLGMGGFVCGPGGLAAKLMGKPLFIHEQNAVAGITNRLLSRFADRIFESFPNTFKSTAKVVYTGNPLRDEIVELHSHSAIATDPQNALRILVLGGSQGAAAINTAIPAMLAQWDGASRPQVLHQTGKRAINETRAIYQEAGLRLSAEIRVVPFINDMADAYQWADLVVCRSGASTVSEIAAAGLPSILVPYPYHTDQQQLHNANWLVNGGAAELLEQTALTPDCLLQKVQGLHLDRPHLASMGMAAHDMAICNASDVIAQSCMEARNV